MPGPPSKSANVAPAPRLRSGQARPPDCRRDARGTAGRIPALQSTINSRPVSLTFAGGVSTAFIRTARYLSSPRRNRCLTYREAGEVVFETAPREDQAPQRLRFSQRFECKRCNIRYEEPEPRLFSFNNPYGACPPAQIQLRSPPLLVIAAS